MARCRSSVFLLPIRSSSRANAIVGGELADSLSDVAQTIRGTLDDGADPYLVIGMPVEAIAPALV